jgi:hypothetical protein
MESNPHDHAPSVSLCFPLQFKGKSGVSLPGESRSVTLFRIRYILEIQPCNKGTEYGLQIHTTRLSVLVDQISK